MARGDVAQGGGRRRHRPSEMSPQKQRLGRRASVSRPFSPHADSFNHFIDEGLGKSIAALEVQEVELNSMPRLRFWIDSVHAGKPVNATGKGIHYKADDAKPLYPSGASAASATAASCMLLSCFRLVTTRQSESSGVSV